MAESDTFRLRLDDFEGSTKTYWQKLQIENDFCDVTLACEDKQIKTHKLIVSACSPVLRNILKLNQNPNPLIYLRRVRYKDLKNLLNFMYQGEVNVAEEDLSNFLEVAGDLNIRGLSEGNKEGFNSKVEQLTQTNHKTKLKRKTTEEKIIEVDNNENNSIEPFIEFEQVCEEFSGKTTEENNSIEPFIGFEQACEEFSGKTTEENNSIEPFIGFEQACEEFSGKTTEDNNSIEPFIGFEQACEEFSGNDVKNSISMLESQIYKTKRENNGYNNQIVPNNQTLVFLLEGDKFVCGKCNYKAIKQNHLNEHVKSIHEGVRHSCDQCDYKATTKSNLKRHLLKYHTGQ